MLLSNPAINRRINLTDTSPRTEILASNLFTWDFFLSFFRIYNSFPARISLKLKAALSRQESSVFRRGADDDPLNRTMCAILCSIRASMDLPGGGGGAVRFWVFCRRAPGLNWHLWRGGPHRDTTAAATALPHPPTPTPALLHSRGPIP